MNRSTVILYHQDCTDGFAAAWAAWKKFKNKAEYIAVAHNHSLPPGLHNKTIYTLDFTYDEATTKTLIATNRQVTSIDHHITRENVIKSTKDYSYSLDRSGSVLAWNYFHPHTPVPRLLLHVEDIDLWKFKLPHTRAILTFVSLYDFNFKVWNRLVRNFENQRLRGQYIKKGELVLTYEQKIIDDIVSNNPVEVEFAGYRTLAVSSPKFISEIGHELSKKLPPIAIVWRQKDGEIKVSLRSDGTVDVAKIAERFGGGGHKAASGFTFPLTKALPWKIITN